MYLEEKPVDGSASFFCFGGRGRMDCIGGIGCIYCKVGSLCSLVVKMSYSQVHRLKTVYPVPKGSGFQ